MVIESLLKLKTKKNERQGEFLLKKKQIEH
jgi:hypothetical protein